MQFFKHYSKASESESLARLIDETGIIGYGRYWLLLEYLTDLFDGESISFRIHSRIVRELFRIRSWTELDSFAERLATVRGMVIKRNGNVFEIEAPILLELQSRDFKRTRKERGESAPKNKIKNKSKEEDKDKEFKKASRPRKAQSTNSDTADNKGNLFVSTYCELFKQKYGVNPTILGKDAGIAKRLSKDLSEEKIKIIIGAYFALPDSWLVKVKHPMSAIETKLNEITVFVDSGKFTTQAEVRQMDSMAQTMSQLERVRRGEL